MLTYRAPVPGLSTPHLEFLTGLLAEHRRQSGCRWRKLSPARQALLVLVHLRCGDSLAQLAVSFEVSPATCYRYVGEAVALLAARAPSLEEALAGRRGKVTILDGTIITTFRVRWTSAHKLWWVHRKRTYGVNLQALAGETGNLLWISDGLPGSTHDLTAARRHGVVDAAVRHGLQFWADRGYQGEAPTLITPVRAGKDKPLIPAATAYNRRHAAVRAPGERGFATLKCWQILTRVRCTVSKIGVIARAILALHHATSTPIRMK
ncbi:IS5 family transposase [Catellatospora sp. IY07-71]|uniref:transposase family protein n=1 Tax=Catellatospora sp. IY07-71 TaxID=2728827 RepID=UPI001BB442BA|nr:transposase family protein [Catellatospora sp. IY07-71]BCJ75310.1 IS5 family transposase [Catellatospora sp. IY07-71]BCJ75655.1 IS5 family transposase [Catellatospora sp. IY07-71]